MGNSPRDILTEEDPERLEGLEEIRKFIDPTLSRTTFYRYHRNRLEPFLFLRPRHWAKHLPRYFTYKRLILVYMLRYASRIRAAEHLEKGEYPMATENGK